MKLKYFLFFFLILNFSSAFSQEEEYPYVEDSAFVETDYDNKLKVDSILKNNPETTNTIYPKTFDPNFKNKYKGEEFDYTTIKPKESLWEKITRRIKKIIESVFGELNPGKATSITEVVLKLFGIIVIGFALYFIIRYIVGKDGNFFFSRKNKKVNIQSGDLHENIHEINFPETILEFEKKGDFRSAIRYQFLFLLKKLSDKKLIDWNPEKTNRDYLYELKSEKLKENYKQLAYIFDNVWYGEFDIDENDYQYYKTKFQTSEL